MSLEYSSLNKFDVMLPRSICICLTLVRSIRGKVDFQVSDYYALGGKLNRFHSRYVCCKVTCCCMCALYDHYSDKKMYVQSTDGTMCLYRSSMNVTTDNRSSRHRPPLKIHQINRYGLDRLLHVFVT